MIFSLLWACVYLLNETFSGTDYKTDAVIQTSLRAELKSDVTVLTVAHRLQTIMDSDRIVRAPFSYQRVERLLKSSLDGSGRGTHRRVRHTRGTHV